jgi:TolA-binding protein
MKSYPILLVLLAGAFYSFSQHLVSQQAADRKFNAAMDLLDHKQYGAAREAFTQYLQSTTADDNKRADAEYYTSFCALNLYHGDAEKMIADFVERNPKHPRSATANFDLANFYYNDKNYKKAGVFYSKVDYGGLTLDEQQTARFRWGYSLFNQRLLAEALEQFNKIKTLGGTYGPASSYYAGFIEYSQGDYVSALSDLKRAEKSESYSKVVPYLIANVYYKQQNYDELIAYAGQVAGQEGVTNPEEISLLSAEAYYKKADYKNALTGYKDYLINREDKADKGVLLRAGYSAFTLSDNTSALNFLRRSASASDSVGFYASYYLGALYLRQNQKPLALTAFDVARKFRKDNRLVEESTYQYAKISYDLGKPDQAISEFEKMLVTFPASVHTDEIKELLSQAYVNATNYNKAIEYIESLPRRSPAVERAYQKATLLKGIELFNKEDYPAAVDFFEKSLRFPVDPHYVAEAAFWNGEAYSIGRRYDQAAQNYLKVIGLTPPAPIDVVIKSRYGLGYAYFNLQQYDRALFNFREFVNKAARNQPNLADGILRLADCYYVTKSYTEALNNYRRVTQLTKVDADYAHLQAGIILGILQRYPEAFTELDMVMRNYPQSRFTDEAIFRKAQLNFDQGNYATAVAGYTSLLQSNPTSKFAPYAYTRRAASYYNLKEYDKTAQDYITVIESFANHPAAGDILLPLQEALNLAGRSADFEKYLTRFKESNPDARGIESVEFETAKNLYFNQDYQRAIQSLGNYIQAYPQSARLNEAKYYQAESCYRLKDNNAALAIYYHLAEDKRFLFANKVIGRIAELEYKAGRYPKAIPYFHQLARLAANRKDQYTAWSGLMESHYLLAQYDSVTMYAELILQKGAVNAGATNKASLFLGKAAMGKGDYETAKDEFINTLNAARDEYGAEAKYLLGEIQFLSKEHKQCYETLISLNTDFAAYPEWVGKSFLLLSDNFLATGDTFQAKATLNSLIDNFPNESIKTIAREKLKRINQAELNKEKQSKKDTLNNN